LQISLPDFRRLCIFKGEENACNILDFKLIALISGIYPREPRNKKKASKTSTPSTTFYYTKDIQYLLHEPLLNKFREHKALAKKISRSLGRGEVGDAARLEKNRTPKITLDHIIKQRYPTFIDALRDLDDALSLLFLFSNLPSTATVPPKTIALCQRLCLEFQHYLIITNSLRKSFLSIKGIYYQATIQGQDILWLVPYKFVQRVTGDVDFRIMGTFVEFYTTLLGFVNYRLYNSIGLIYPPRFNTSSDEQGGELNAFTLEGRPIEPLKEQDPVTNGDTAQALVSNGDAQKQIDTIMEIAESGNEVESNHETPQEETISDAIDVFEATGEGADILPQPQISGTEAATLFAPFTFYLSRETPRQPLEFILRAFGCKRIGWDAVLGDGAFTNNQYDTSITHQIVDRPPLAQASFPDMSNGNVDGSDKTSTEVSTTNGRMPGRIYIQPQWVWDCINSCKLLRPDLYAPGAMLPPHLSPWVKPTKGAYDPTTPLAEQEREGEAAEAEGLDVDESEEDEAADPADAATSRVPKSSVPDLTSQDEHGMDIAGSASDSDSDASVNSAASSFAGFDSDAVSSASETAIQEVQHQRELEAEAAGISFSGNAGELKGNLKRGGIGEEARKKADRKRRAEEEELERRKMMMGNRKRKVLEKMLYSNRKKDEEAERLRGKRRRIEAKMT
jgi:pescadillo protein